MGYSFKIIDKRRQEAPFLILEKNIYQNLQVSTIAEVISVGKGLCKLKAIPDGTYFESSYSLSQDSYTMGDIVLVLILDKYGTEELNETTSNIMHDYQNAVILGKLHNL